MNHPLMNTILDGVLILLLLWRIHNLDLFESGTMLRIGLLMGFFWLFIGDLDNLVGHIDFGEMSTYGSLMRTGVAKALMICGVCCDVARAYYSILAKKKTERLKNFVAPMARDNGP